MSWLVFILSMVTAYAASGDDLDGDGYCELSFEAGGVCDDPNAIPGDCDDSDATVYPGAPELCDGKDNNCNGSSDEIPFDVDGDGFSAPTACSGSQDDCNDYLASVYPGASETCDGIDEDCDGVIDNEVSIDLDGDGAFAPGCVPLGAPVDCDDQDGAVHPGAPEVLGDSIDNNCDGFPDVSVEYVDNDLDGYCEGIISVGDCLSMVSVFGVNDCDDTDPTISFNSYEWLDGIDNDCNGVIDDLDPLDRDKDGYCGHPTECIGKPELKPGDCNDSNSAVHPGAEERCNGVDDNCDGLIWLTLDERDIDGDGYLACEGCDQGVLCGDCDDTNDQINPGQAERCGDGIDNDCDTVIDLKVDLDGDGHFTCIDDCNDSNAAVFLDSPEVCDGFDNDCDGEIDEGFDRDGDGFRVCDGDCDDASVFVNPARTEICGDGIDNNCDGLSDEDGNDDGDRLSRCAGDCDDTNPYVHALHPEICDGIDNDCDGLIDETYDKDSDGQTVCFGDCNDDPDQSGELAFSGRDETEADCDSLDNDCNGVVDDLWPDSDLDGYTECQGDCDNEEGWGTPDGGEQCDDEIDNDCDGDIDAADLDCVIQDTGPGDTANDVQIRGSIPPGWFCSSSGVSGFPALSFILLLIPSFRRQRCLSE